jgi:hypothetical protein
MIRIELFPPSHPARGHTIAAACEISVRGRAPVLSLCRKLIQAGHDPAAPAEAYRGSTLCLHIRSIGEAAELGIYEPASGGGPRLMPYGSRHWVGAGIVPEFSLDSEDDCEKEEA